MIYHDNGAAKGRRTRFFRDAAGGGVEWIYGADYANGDRRWYAFNVMPDATIEKLKASGMFLSRLEDSEGGWL